MEMQEVPAKAETEDKEKEKGAEEPKLEVKTEEEAEREHYSNLLSPSEEVYAEAFHTVKPHQELPGSARLYWAISGLSVVCFILLLTVVILGVKRDACPDCCPSSTKVNSGDHVDRSVSLTPPSPTTLETIISVQVQAEPTAYSGGKEAHKNREGPSVVSMEKLCMEHFRKTSNSGKSLPAATKERLCSEHLQSCCSGSEDCPYKWFTFGNYCFFLSTFTLPWEHSQSKCTSICGSLAVVNSQDVQNFLTEKGHLTYWIGLRQHQSAWNWVDNKTLERSYWTSNPGNGDCTLLKSTDPPEGNWLKASCLGAAYFICQLEY